MDNFDFEKMPIEEISSFTSSSSFSPSLDDDMLPIIGAFLQHQQEVQKQMLFLIQLKASSKIADTFSVKDLCKDEKYYER